MRFMIIVKATADSEAGVMPAPELIAGMGRYNEALIAAGVLLAADGLHSSANGARVKLENGRLAVTDGPFAETRELIAGYWLIDVKSRDEALEWVKRIPFEEGQEIELRKVFEASDFPADTVTDAHLAAEQTWRDANQKPIGS